MFMMLLYQRGEVVLLLMQPSKEEALIMLKHSPELMPTTAMELEDKAGRIIMLWEQSYSLEGGGEMEVLMLITLVVEEEVLLVLMEQDLLEEIVISIIVLLGVMAVMEIMDMVVRAVTGKQVPTMLLLEHLILWAVVVLVVAFHLIGGKEKMEGLQEVEGVVVVNLLVVLVPMDR